MEDGIGGGGAPEGWHAGVVGVGEVADLLLEWGHRGKGAVADGPLGDEVEPALDLVEPRGIGGGEMKVIAGPGREPALDLDRLVGAVVVNGEVDIQVRGPVGVNGPEEAQERLVAMSRLAQGQDLADGDVPGGKERGGAVTDVVVRDPFDVAELEGSQRRVRSSACVRLFSSTQNPITWSGGWRLASDDIADLLGEEGVGGELDVLRPVGLKVERPPAAVDRGLRPPRGFLHGPAAPVRAAGS